MEKAGFGRPVSVRAFLCAPLCASSKRNIICLGASPGFANEERGPVLFTSRPSPRTEEYDWSGVRTALVRYVRGRTGRMDVADDIAQEALARLIAFHQSQKIDSIMALGFRMADNLVVDMYRREQRLSGEVDESMACTRPSTERVLDSRLAVEILSRTLEEMPRLRREVVIRRRLKRQSCRVISEEMAISLKAVEKHITRGLMDLHDAFQRAGLNPKELGE